MANDTEFGLAAYLYTRDLARSWRVSEATRIRHRGPEHRHHFHRGRAVRRREGVRHRPRGFEVRDTRLHRNEIRMRGRGELAHGSREPARCSGGSSSIRSRRRIFERPWSSTPSSDSLRRRWARPGRIPMRWSPTAESAWACTRHPTPTPGITFVKPDLLRHLSALENAGAGFRVSPTRQRRVQRARLARPFRPSDTAGRGPHLQPRQALRRPTPRCAAIFSRSRLPAPQRDGRQGLLGKTRVCRHR